MGVRFSVWSAVFRYKGMFESSLLNASNQGYMDSFSTVQTAFGTVPFSVVNNIGIVVATNRIRLSVMKNCILLHFIAK